MVAASMDALSVPWDATNIATLAHCDAVRTPSAPLDEAAHVRGASLADLGGEHWAKPIPPEPDGLMADVDPALGQEIFDVAQRQRVSHVHHHHQTDDLRRAVEISERVANSSSLAWPEGPRAFGPTSPLWAQQSRFGLRRRQAVSRSQLLSGRNTCFHARGRLIARPPGRRIRNLREFTRSKYFWADGIATASGF
jgi:hypothetical protein